MDNSNFNNTIRDRIFNQLDMNLSGLVLDSKDYTYLAGGHSSDGTSVNFGTSPETVLGSWDHVQRI